MTPAADTSAHSAAPITAAVAGAPTGAASAATSFHAPTALAEALALLQRVGAGGRPLAGGSDLIVQLRDPARSGRPAPAALVDIKRLPGLIGITPQAGGGWRIGAATPCAVIGEHAALRADWPGVVEAATLIGSHQVQGRASLGGNLCNGSPAADSVPALIAAGATAVLGRADGAGGVVERRLPVAAIPAGPGRTTLAPDELLLALALPPRPARGGDAYLRLIPRSEMDIAVVGCGIALTLADDGRIAEARVALGAVAPTAVLVPAAAEALRGRRLDDTTLAALADAVRAACQPIDDKRGTAAYRTRVAGVLAQRAARLAAERAAR